MTADETPQPWISDREWNALGPYIADLLTRLRLSDWTITLAKEHLPDDADANAIIYPCEGRKRARLQLCRDWPGLDADRKRHTIVHELIHCHHAAASDIIRLDTGKHLSQSTYDVLYAGFVRQMEYMTDGLADAIAPFMPEYPSTEN